MSNNRLDLDLNELKAGLRELSTSVSGTGEAGDIVIGKAHEAARRMVDKYPSRTGNLKNGVKVTASRSQHGVVATVKNTAKHAALFEKGTQARHTSIGANRGSMPAGKVFIPTMIQKRREKDEALRALLVRHGLIVSGDGG